MKLGVVASTSGIFYPHILQTAVSFLFIFGISFSTELCNPVLLLHGYLLQLDGVLLDWFRQLDQGN